MLVTAVVMFGGKRRATRLARQARAIAAAAIARQYCQIPAQMSMMGHLCSSCYRILCPWEADLGQRGYRDLMPASIEGLEHKAIHISPRVVIPICEVKKISGRMMNDAQRGERVVPAEITVCGLLSKISDKFFEADPPIVSFGNKELMCWKTQVQDATGSIAVTVWNNTCSALFGINADKMREYWEAGRECQVRRSEIIRELNAKLGFDVVCNCTADVWSYGFKVTAYELHINICRLTVKDV